MVLFATPAPHGAGPMTISGYAWGHIVATGPQQSAGTSAPLILTHDPCIWRKGLTVQQATCISYRHTLRSVFVIAGLSRLLFHPFRTEVFASFPNG